MALIGLFSRPGPSGFGYNATAEDVTAGRDLTGKTYVVTGCTSGLGEETLRVLALRGARVIGTARTLDKAKAACDAVSGSTVPVACELSEPASVRAAVAEIRELGPIDGLVANAGIMALPEREVKYGFELQFLTNHVGHFLMVTGLLDRLSPTGRVVMVSSRAHFRTYAEGVRLDDLGAERGYDAWGAYGQSKICNLLFARELSRRLPPGQTAYSLHPGVIATNLGRHLNPVLAKAFQVVGPLALKTIPQGSATQCYLATHPDALSGNGEYWADSNVAVPSTKAREDGLARALYDKSLEIAATL